MVGKVWLLLVAAVVSFAYKGIPQNGNTCFASSAIQLLIRVPAVREAIIMSKVPEEDTKEAKLFNSLRKLVHAINYEEEQERAKQTGQGKEKEESFLSKAKNAALSFFSNSIESTSKTCHANLFDAMNRPRWTQQDSSEAWLFLYDTCVEIFRAQKSRVMDRFKQFVVFSTSSLHSTDELEKHESCVLLSDKTMIHYDTLQPNWRDSSKKYYECTYSQTYEPVVISLAVLSMMEQYTQDLQKLAPVSLESRFANLASEELLDSSNLVFNDLIGLNGFGRRSTLLCNMPSVLQVNLGRFINYNDKLYSTKRKVNYPSVFDIQPYTVFKDFPLFKHNPLFTYHLVGFSVHPGTAMLSSISGGGHYYSFFIDPSNLNQWIKFNDGSVSIHNSSEIIHFTNGVTSLVYVQQARLLSEFPQLAEIYNIPFADDLKSNIEYYRLNVESIKAEIEKHSGNVDAFISENDLQALGLVSQIISDAEHSRLKEQYEYMLDSRKCTVKGDIPTSQEIIRSQVSPQSHSSSSSTVSLTRKGRTNRNTFQKDPKIIEKGKAIIEKSKEYVQEAKTFIQDFEDAKKRNLLSESEVEEKEKHKAVLQKYIETVDEYESKIKMYFERGNAKQESTLKEIEAELSSLELQIKQEVEIFSEEESLEESDEESKTEVDNNDSSVKPNDADSHSDSEPESERESETESESESKIDWKHVTDLNLHANSLNKLTKEDFNSLTDQALKSLNTENVANLNPDIFAHFDKDSLEKLGDKVKHLSYLQIKQIPSASGRKEDLANLNHACHVLVKVHESLSEDAKKEVETKCAIFFPKKKKQGIGAGVFAGITVGLGVCLVGSAAAVAWRLRLFRGKASK